MKQLPAWIDPLRLCRQSTVLQGQLPLKDLPRLAECLKQAAGTVDFCLNFLWTPDQKPLIQGKIQANLVFCCQRCGEPVDEALDLAIRLCPLLDEDGINDLADDLDFLVTYGQPVCLTKMIEDELLINCPEYPKHPEGKCLKKMPDYLG